MKSNDLFNIKKTPLNKITAQGGDVYHAMKKSDSDFAGFGEAYFSWINGGAIKAWKFHHDMTLNFIVPLGQVKFVFVINPDKGKQIFQSHVIGEKNYCRVTVPPKIWFGFQGLFSPKSLVLNVSNTEHNQEEYEKKNIDEFIFDWS